MRDKRIQRFKHRFILLISFACFLISTLILTTVNHDVIETMSEQDVNSSFDASQEIITTNSDMEPINRNKISIIPGGQSIGVQLQTLGVLVVGHHIIQGEAGKLSPGEEAKVNIGDIIVEINGNEIKTMGDIKPFVNEAGKNNKALNIKIKRGKETIETSLNPAFDKKDNEYKIGLYIRDSAAGIGTMTFYDPDTKRYGALGHIISDISTRKPIEMLDGTIVGSSVTAIEKANNGNPGEKQARFSMERNKLGSILKNTPHGIFGVLNDNISNGLYDDPLEITQAHEVKEGPAKILTVVDKEKVEEFDIEIISSTPQKKQDIKGMVIKITDEALLERTGGIVQGMSGSPIIQDGKLVGAVTHVFVNDPTSGYGVHIEWMLQDADINLIKRMKQAQ